MQRSIVKGKCLKAGSAPIRTGSREKQTVASSARPAAFVLGCQSALFSKTPTGSVSVGRVSNEHRRKFLPQLGGDGGVGSGGCSRGTQALTLDLGSLPHLSGAMATGADVRDILELGGPEGDAASGTISKKDIINPDKKKSKKSSETLTFKRPEGMHREVYALLYSDKKDAPPLLPSDTGQGYRTVKAKLGSKKVRPWKWMPFTNPARKDGAMFFHWRRAAEEGKDYPFARFNKVSYFHSNTAQDCPPTLSHLCKLSSLLGLAPGARLCPTVVTHPVHMAMHAVTHPVLVAVCAEWDSMGLFCPRDPVLPQTCSGFLCLLLSLQMLLFLRAVS
uniref:DNA methyltransferase 1 associated protein 1 n=1 Tax=Callithrix jacchus TaxID=9483 RepID=A0A8I3ZZZ5_CALJA